MQAKVAWFDRDQSLIRQFKTGVSIHSHTNRSKESLEFVGRFLDSHPVLRYFKRVQTATVDKANRKLDFVRAYWTPPLCPRSAYELEKQQIENRLDLRPLVSLTDHDGIEAPMLLRVVPAMKDVPVSLEWTVPFQSAKFHLGVHNLPGERAQEWMETLAEYTAEPSTKRLCELLAALSAIPEVLVVFNHPLWNLYGAPAAEFEQNVEDFLAINNSNLHALELNGMRRWDENRRVAALAARWQQLLISGGDRHGCEPNGNLNLTNAASFAEWVHELRVERRSQLLFMPQYNDSFVARCYQTFLDAIREYPEHSDGAWRWDHRTFHPARDGSMQPISALWRDVPGFLRVMLDIARLAETTQLLHQLRVCGGTRVGSMAEIAGQKEIA